MPFDQGTMTFRICRLPKSLPEDALERRLVDYVAGMTDEYAFRLYQRLLLPVPWKP